MAQLRIIFMGTAGLACPSLGALLLQPDFSVVAVVTQPDRPKGRHLKLQPSPVKELALQARLPVLQPARARHESFLLELGALRPDLIVVAAYGQILSQPLLDLPRLGCLNVHTSLLPKYRGAAPIQWALLEGEAETGVTIMKMDAGLDTGPILARQSTSILDADDSQTLHDRLAQMGAALLVQAITAFAAGTIRPRPQSGEGVSYARKIVKEDGVLDWTQPARSLWNRIRAFTPWPGASTCLPGSAAPQLLKIWRAEIVDLSGGPGEVVSADKAGLVVGCGQDALRILELQREGGRRMNPSEFLLGHPLQPGRKLGG